MEKTKEQAKNYKEFCKLIMEIRKIIEEDNLKIVDIVSKIDLAFDNSIFECNRKIYEIDDDKYEPGSEFMKIFTLKTAFEIGNKIFVPNGNYKTIHKSKGKEFNTVLVDLKPSAVNEESSISAIEVVLNPFIYGDDVNNKELYEFVRIFYVGISRAINELIVVLEGNEEQVNELETKLNQYANDEKITNKFYEIIIK